MRSIDPTILLPLARKYIWWKAPEQAVRTPLRVVAQVMDIGDYADVQRLLHEVGPAPFRSALAEAEAGQFRPCSWAYWHYRLGSAQPGALPPLPKRRLPAG